MINAQRAFQTENDNRDVSNKTPREDSKNNDSPRIQRDTALENQTNNNLLGNNINPLQNPTQI